MIEINDLSLVINKKRILSEIKLRAEQSKITGLVGDNGSGKTMIMKCICGLITAYTGNIIINNKNLRETDAAELNMGVIIETPGFIPYFSGYKNLKCLAQIKGTISDKQIKESMEYVGLDFNKRLKVSEYSLGMRQRLGIAQAIMEEPDILILDEPFNGLDSKTTKKIRNKLLEIKGQGKTIVLSSHNQEDIDMLCDTVYIVNDGRIKNDK